MLELCEAFLTANIWEFFFLSNIANVVMCMDRSRRTTGALNTTITDVLVRNVGKDKFRFNNQFNLRNFAWHTYFHTNENSERVLLMVFSLWAVQFLFVVKYLNQHNLFIYRQSYDVTIELRIEGTTQTSSNTLDLKNPYFRYTGAPVQPPPGVSNISPSENYWNQLDAQGVRNGKMYTCASCTIFSLYHLH